MESVLDRKMKGGVAMELLEQCRKWNENKEYQKLIDALENISADERTPEMDSELAKAYIAIADIGEREPYEEGSALPRFEKNFRERTQEAWAAFAGIEGELRAIMEADKLRERSEEIIEKCSGALELALSSPAFELGFNGEKYELILSAEGSRAGLFPLVYFQCHVPASVREHWNILVGRQPSAEFSLRSGPDEIRPEDVQVWVEQQEDGRLSLTLYCEKILPLQQENVERAWWLLSTLTDQVLGEVNFIAHIGGFDLIDAPKKGPVAFPAVSLEKLPQMLKSLGLTDYRDGADFLENSYITYELDPVKDPDADWRLDVYTGSNRLPVLINEYMSAQSDMMNEYRKDGIVAGFLCYPLNGFEGGNRAEQILQFRDTLQDAIQKHAGEDAVTFLGGATGLYYGYLDFIAWDLLAVLDAARAFFADTDLTWSGFHVFRRDVGAVRLWEQEKEPEVDPETGSLLSAQNIETLGSFQDEISGYFGQMLCWLEDFIEQGVQEGKFTQRQVHQDLQIALWYSFACNNLDEYRYYCKAADWMKDSEKNAVGCAMWYYRYSVALMYCGRLEEALNYAEKGIQEEPGYPWIWLQAGKLRSHFGDKAGALEAVAHGLALEPDDYEFLTLKKEIENGAPLEQMEYHWINPDADQTLQQGLDENADDKQRSISCITVNKEGLECFWMIFGPKPEQYTPNAPFTQFPYRINNHSVDLVFQMNEGGMSKLNTDWLEQLKGWIQDGQWLEREHPDGRAARLDTVLVGLDYHIGLLYKLTDEDVYFQIFLNPDGTEQEGTFWSSEEKSRPELYTEEEMSAVEKHIKRFFGEFDHVFHELVSPDIHVDICVITPSEERDYYSLVTMGMGAHRMNVPEELAEYRLERAELAIALPPDWKLDEESMKEEKWYWPIGLLKVLARLPAASDTWLGFGHTMDKQSPFAKDTKLCASLLTGPQGVEDGCEVCILPNGETVNFYQVIPLYRDEMEYKLEHNADALIEKMAEVSFVVQPERPNCLHNLSIF